MRTRAAAGLALCLALAAGCRDGAAKAEGPFAVLETSLGVIVVRLLPRAAPRTVEHFVALATGGKAWRDPRTGRARRAPLYDGLTFHRIVPGFMIQTGDPRGDGRGDIGLTVADEIGPGLRFDRPGVVGMANFGRDANGSQFFITVAPAPELDGRHTIFGEVAAGLGVAAAISRVARDESEGSDLPLRPVRLKRLRIVERL
ncbi:MAG: peptidylprolyl isomerase [Elusimicrobia bacterium]|nr:peptidylprolyl isomerase [Elusimicrobiota bacterium]